MRVSSIGEIILKFLDRMNKNFLRMLFLNYSYVISIVHKIADVLPPVLRNIILKLILRSKGKNCFIDTGVYFRYPKRIVIGNNVSINRGCEFYPSYFVKDAIVSIGNNVRFGPGVKLLCAGHDHSSIDLPDVAMPITIHDNCWIGASAIILPGVTLAEGTVIGAGAVVTKSTLPYNIYAGVPAKRIKERVIT